MFAKWRNCQGTLLGKDGSVSMLANFKVENFQDQGTYTYSDGAVYDRKLLKEVNQMDLEVYKFINGDLYVGEFKVRFFLWARNFY